MMLNKVKNIEGVPIWEYLTNDAVNKDTTLTNKDFGRFAEIIGKRITWKELAHKYMANGLRKDREGDNMGNNVGDNLNKIMGNNVGDNVGDNDA